MYKIKYLSTGHIFELPKETAEDLKKKFPSEYQILEKNGKKYKDKIVKKMAEDSGSIYSKVVEKQKVGKNEQKSR